jgi:hypothetical protein
MDIDDFLKISIPKTERNSNVHKRVLQQLRWFWDTPDQDIFNTVYREFRGCGRDVTYDIWHSIANGRRFLAKVNGWSLPDDGSQVPAGGTTSFHPRLTDINRLAQSQVIRGGRDAGLVYGNGSGESPEAILEGLFGGEMVCIGREKWSAQTGFLSEFGDLAGFQFIVPNPMERKWGKTQLGKDSQRALESVKERWFLIVEFDDPNLGLVSQEKILWHLGKLRRLLMIVWSGNKSLHGWFEVRGSREEESLSFFEYAMSLGADPPMWNAHQWCRLPGGTNGKTGNQQRVLYFDL